MFYIKENVNMETLTQFGYEKIGSQYVKEIKGEYYYNKPVAITIDDFGCRTIRKCYMWTTYFLELRPVLYQPIIRNNRYVNVNRDYIKDLIDAKIVVNAKYNRKKNK